MLNLNKLEEQLDESLENETKESLTNWLTSKRKKVTEIDEDLGIIDEIMSKYPNTMNNLADDAEEVLNEYKLLHSKIYDIGVNKGIELYERGFSSEHTFNYIIKYNPYSIDTEANAYLEGTNEGWKIAEEDDCSVNPIKEENNEF